MAPGLQIAGAQQPVLPCKRGSQPPFLPPSKTRPHQLLRAAGSALAAASEGNLRKGLKSSVCQEGFAFAPVHVERQFLS